MVVKDADEAIGRYESLEFPAKGEVSFSQTDAKGRKIQAGREQSCY